MTLYNNFLLKRGVGLFSRVGLISGDTISLTIINGLTMQVVDVIVVGRGEESGWFPLKVVALVTSVANL